MLIYNDIYTWEGPANDESSLWLLSCRLWLIDLTLSQPNILHLKPSIVVAQDLNNGLRRKICAETLGRQIYNDFKLDIQRTLWIEYDPDLPGKLAVATMKPKYHDGIETIYAINWRQLLQSEVDIVRKFIPEIKL